MAKPDFTSLVVPSIKVEGDTRDHALVALFKEQSLDFKALGTVNIPGSKLHVSFVATLRGSPKGIEVVRLDVESPDLKAIAIDNAKTQFVTHFLDSELTVL